MQIHEGARIQTVQSGGSNALDRRTPEDVVSAWSDGGFSDVFRDDKNELDVNNVPTPVAEAFNRIVGTDADVSSLWGPVRVAGRGDTYGIWDDHGNEGVPVLTIVDAGGHTIGSGFAPLPDEDGYTYVVWN